MAAIMIPSDTSEGSRQKGARLSVRDAWGIGGRGEPCSKILHHASHTTPRYTPAQPAGQATRSTRHAPRALLLLTG